ncbi:aldehyde dehydrogenase family protein [Muriicola jejuensis]|uniref:Aldehyde dehydrogenase n=2 Tax=Muriicola jejuensis TaxID=504488 RepID=A0A6P0UDR5_9FLAO|nr:aldehyde dehydrogenase family protein [Muriicola jejuensis]
MRHHISKDVESQRQFFNSGRTQDLKFRKGLLKKLRTEIIRQENAICDALYADFKKPRFETLIAETQFVLAELNTFIRYLELWARPERVPASLLNFPSSDYIYKEPYGTVLIIAPWNYPFQLTLLPLISAIAAGNTAVLKPSELTPHTSKLINELVASVFDPAHAMVFEGDAVVSKALLEEKWDYIFFTGSTRVGKIVYEKAASNLTPVTLELGGKSPCIVDDSAPVAQAARRIVWGKFLNAGQTCIAPDYILVHASAKARLVEELQKSIRSFFGDDPERSPDLARIISDGHFQRLIGLLEGQQLLSGGQHTAGDRYIAPTLVDEPDKNSKIMKEEIFGPLLPIISFEEEDELDAWISSYGKPLAAYVFSKRSSFQKRILRKHRFGGGVINDTLIHISNKNLPFGGVGQSGLGAYHGKRSFDAFSHKKAIVKRGTWLDLKFRNPPYTLPIGLIKKLKHLL